MYILSEIVRDYIMLSKMDVDTCFLRTHIEEYRHAMPSYPTHSLESIIHSMFLNRQNTHVLNFVLETEPDVLYTYIIYMSNSIECIFHICTHGLLSFGDQIVHVYVNDDLIETFTKRLYASSEEISLGRRIDLLQYGLSICM